jgi:hypothetical protein
MKRAYLPDLVLRRRIMSNGDEEAASRAKIVPLVAE